MDEEPVTYGGELYTSQKPGQPTKVYCHRHCQEWLLVSPYVGSVNGRRDCQPSAVVDRERTRQELARVFSYDYGKGLGLATG